jgi:hypothetical protein
MEKHKNFFRVLDLMSSQKEKKRFSVIPAEAGIQSFQIVMNSLDSGFHRSDDFLRSHQISFGIIIILLFIYILCVLRDLCGEFSIF